MFRRRRALTQVQAILIVLIIVVAGAGAYFLGLIPGTTSILNPGSSTTITHSTTPLPASLSPGTTKTQGFMFGGYNRTYSLHISKINDASKSTPLVIMLHGLGEYVAAMPSMTGLTAKSDKEGFIVAYPQGVGYTASWNVMFGMGEAYSKKVDDVGFIRELIYRVKQVYKIDPDRIYVTGFSNGATLTYRLGSELSDVVAAIAPVSGSTGGRANATAPLKIFPNPSQPVAVIVFHGTADDSVDYYGKPNLLGIFLSVHDSVTFWVNADGCSKTAQNTTSADGKTVKSVYSGGLKGTEVVLNTIVGGGHAWPSNATDLIWDFFKSYPKQH